MRTRLWFALASVVALSIVTTSAGSWAVITVETLPEQFVVGQPTDLKFAVRQHGIRLLPGLSARVSAVADGRQVDAVATPVEPGHYQASLTLPRAGTWEITIQSGFVTSALTLRPVKAVASAAPPPRAALAERGLDLFVAKGCNSCHYHGATKVQPIARVGEDLTDKRYSEALLSMMLTNPSILPKRDPWEMPDLKLKADEIAALVAFINRPRAE